MDRAFLNDYSPKYNKHGGRIPTLKDVDKGDYDLEKGTWHPSMKETYNEAFDERPKNQELLDLVKPKSKKGFTKGVGGE
jgi:hypothetical protein